MSQKVEVENKETTSTSPITRCLRTRTKKTFGTPFPVVKRGRVKNVLSRRSSVLNKSTDSSDVTDSGTSSANTSANETSSTTSMELTSFADASSSAVSSADSSMKETTPDTTLTTTTDDESTNMTSDMKDLTTTTTNDDKVMDMAVGSKDMTLDTMDTPMVSVIKKKRGRPVGWRKSTYEAKKTAEALAKAYAASDKAMNVSTVDAGTSTCDLDSSVDSTPLATCLTHMSVSSPPVRSSMAPRIPRPANAFMIFGRENRKKVAAEFPNSTNKFISTKLGERWRELDEESKAPYKAMAKEAVKEHKMRFPGYIYSPMEARIKKAAKRKLVEERKSCVPMSIPEEGADRGETDETNKENVNPNGEAVDGTGKTKDGHRQALAPLDMSRDADVSSNGSESFLVNPGPSTTSVRKAVSSAKKDKQRPKIRAISEIFVAPPGYEDMEIDGLDKFVLYKNKLVPFQEWMDAEGDIGRMNWNLYTVVPPQLLLPIVECINESDANEAAYHATMAAGGEGGPHPVDDVATDFVSNGDNQILPDMQLPSTSSAFHTFSTMNFQPLDVQQQPSTSGQPDESMLTDDVLPETSGDAREDQEADAEVAATLNHVVDDIAGHNQHPHHGGDYDSDIAEGVALLTNLMRGAGRPVPSASSSSAVGDCNMASTSSGFGTTSASGFTSGDC